MREVGIYLNQDKENSIEMALKCKDYLRSHGVNVAFLGNQMHDKYEKGVSIYPKDEFFIHPDCIVVLGGDGTLLSVARQSCIYGMPLFGINLGKLGFLTEGESANYKNLLDILCRGESYFEKRMMLSCKILREDGRQEEFTGLNDVLVKNAGFRMMMLKTYVGDAMLDSFRADGLIVSTPTGSTAYSLAAGGPVVAPGTDVMVVNPVCPHRMHDRAYVIGPTEKIKIQFNENEHDVVVLVDGQTKIFIGGKDTVIVEKSLYTTDLIRLNGMSFYGRLRNKLTDDAHFCGEE